MPHADAIDWKAPPFDHFTSIQLLGSDRSGRDSFEYARHQLYAGRDKRSRTGVLIKMTSKPGIVYEHNIANEFASLSTINRELPDSRYFPVVHDYGRLRDGRVYLVTSLFDELPLAASIGTERIPERMVAHLMTAIEVARALDELHGLQIFHVDLNPMNILYRSARSKPVIGIVDFESSYEVARHTKGEVWNPPTTPGYSAPEIPGRLPDARSDLFSLGAVLYTMLVGYRWTWESGIATHVQADRELDADLKETLLAAVDPDPGKRYPSVRQFQGHLAAHLERIWPGRSW
jgi:serine/threonine protein kinase